MLRNFRHSSFRTNSPGGFFSFNIALTPIFHAVHKMKIPAHTIIEVIDMASYVSPKIRDKFETLSVDLKNCILERNVHLETLQDLIKVLDEIVKEGS